MRAKMLKISSVAMLIYRVLAQAALRGSRLERFCSGMGLPPKSSHRYGFYLGLALTRAAEQSNMLCLNEILNLQDPPVNATVADSVGLTALTHVVKRGDVGSVKRLLPLSDVHCATFSCRAPLCFASSRGHEEITTALLNAGANVDAPDAEGRSPLQLASLGGHVAVVTELLRARGSVTLAGQEDGRTALHRASSRGHVEVVNLLLEAGAKLFAVDSWNHTAFDIAVQNEHRNVASTLSLEQLDGLREEV